MKFKALKFILFVNSCFKAVFMKTLNNRKP